jgi:hypothetical protein
MLSHIRNIQRAPIVWMLKEEDLTEKIIKSWQAQATIAKQMPKAMNNRLK